MLFRAIAPAALALLAGAALAQDAPAPLTATSEAGTYEASLAPQADPIPLNTIQSWTLTLSDAEGEPVEGATFAIDGGMPAHGHGLPTAPEVTEDLGEGRYLIEGIRFSMAGEWVLSLAVSAEPGDDTIVFRFTL